MYFFLKKRRELLKLIFFKKKMIPYGVSEIIVCVIVVSLQIILTNTTANNPPATDCADSKHYLCAGGLPIWAYAWVGGIVYTVALILILNRRWLIHAATAQSLAMALLSAPFVYLIIRPCYLAIVTYASFEFCINCMLPNARSVSDLTRILLPFGIKMYVYVCYTMIDTDHDNNHSVILYLIFDGAAMFFRFFFASSQPSKESESAEFVLLMTRLTTVHFVFQAITAQIIGNVR